tara:strand:- start:4403 stop:5347 length:945 start_codon:yes stop_codon:yes gene_type:complete
MRAILAVLWLQLQACHTPTTTAPHPTAAWFDIVAARPGSEVTDAAMRQRITASGHPWKVRDRATGIELVLVMPGEFLMGSPESEPHRQTNEGPQHRVRLTQAFYLGATEITQAQWRHVMGSSQGFFQDDRKPADGSWHDLQAFLAKANAGVPASSNLLRAPSEAEWEYACRAGTTGPFNFSGLASHDVCNFNDGTPKNAKVVNGKLEVEWTTPPSPACRMTTAAAGSLPPNAWGLHEMHGNLCEWTADAYTADGYQGRGLLTVDPLRAATGREVHTLRGGDWYKSAHHSRSAARDKGGPQTRSNRIGFRVARTL